MKQKKRKQNNKTKKRKRKKRTNPFIRRQITLVKFICLHKWKKYFL